MRIVLIFVAGRRDPPMEAVRSSGWTSVPPPDQAHTVTLKPNKTQNGLRRTTLCVIGSLYIHTLIDNLIEEIKFVASKRVQLVRDLSAPARSKPLTDCEDLNESSYFIFS